MTMSGDTYIYRKREVRSDWASWDETIAKAFLFLGFLIPVLLTLGRIVTPDTAFDSINYHTFLGARGLNWFRFSESEFFPLGYWSFFPGYDAINALGRIVLGYRLGSSFGLLFQLGILFLLIKIYQLLKITTGSKALDVFFLVSASFSLEGLLQLGSYLTDVLNGFVFVLALYFFISALVKDNNIYIYLVSFILSLAFLCKNTNLFYVAPFFLYLIIETFKTRKLKVFLISAVIFLIVVSPWLIYNYRTTANPFTPILILYLGLSISR